MTHIDFRQCWNYSQGREGLEPDRIVIHHWGADGQSHDGVVDFFTRGPGSGTSAHYVVSAGRITQICHDYDTAYHAGNWQINLRSIGIECRPEASEDDVRTVAELVRRIRSEWGNLPLSVHSDYYPTACPGRYHDLIDRINQLSQEEETDMQLTDQVTRPDGHTATVNDVLAYIDLRLERIDAVLIGGQDKKGPDGKPTGDRTNVFDEAAWNATNFARVYQALDALGKKIEDLTKLIEVGTR
ncbi:N-acetylmuramoyl-L-alanine amidase [Schaalia odontolytica]|uniref:N-acetylmuramoyl-L-alanine amidase n=1 Tax=Schaalia odontolytica TaxID=1660 RepID=A0A6N2TAU2_9ACTO